MTQATDYQEITKDMIHRLVAIAPLLRIATITGWALGLGVLLSILSALLLQDVWWLGGILGAAVGYGIGSVFAAFFNLTIEWMVRNCNP
jgi:Zn-dependent M32 family carboxypeptidase